MSSSAPVASWRRSRWAATDLGAADELGGDPVVDERAVLLAPGVPAGFLGAGERDGPLALADAADPQAIARGEPSCALVVGSDHDVGRNGDIGFGADRAEGTKALR